MRELSLDETPISEDGTLANRQHAAMLSMYLSLHAGRTVRLRVGPPRRTPAQNRYYWLLLETIRAALVDAGYAEYTDRQAGCQVLHRYYASKYLGVETYALPGGAHETRPVSTSRQDRAAFFEYTENIRMDDMVLALGITLPDPDSYERTVGPFRSYQIAEPE